MPTAQDVSRLWEGRVTLVDEAADPTGKQVKIWAEIRNDQPGFPRLSLNTPATLAVLRGGPKQ